MLNVELQIKLLKKLKITQAQLFYLICVYEDKLHLLEEYRKLYGIGKHDGYIGMIAYNQLVTDGYLEITDGHTFVSEKFKSLYVDKFAVFADLQHHYPDFCNVNGVMTSLKVLDEDVYREKYAKKILNSVAEHQEVLLDIKYAEAAKYNFVALRNFIDSSLWNSFRKARKKEEQSHPATTSGKNRVF